tara:strand:+ start:185 stop:571 length:387 start_codon:yes stop_codon:yes gene_type:complete
MILEDLVNASFDPTKTQKYVRWYTNACHRSRLYKWSIEKYFKRCEIFTGALKPGQKFGMLRGMIIIALQRGQDIDEAFDFINELEEETENFGKTPEQIRWDAHRELVLFRNATGRGWITDASASVEFE